jgi:hypothetical protein
LINSGHGLPAEKFLKNSSKFQAGMNLHSIISNPPALHSALNSAPNPSASNTITRHHPNYPSHVTRILGNLSYFYPFDVCRILGKKTPCNAIKE